MKKWITSALLALGLVSTAASYASTYMLPLPGDDVVGKIHIVHAQPGQTLDDIARLYDIGHYEILEANPHINPLNLLPYQQVVIPAQYLLPNAPRKGIVINLAELRLFYYPENSNVVETYPVGIGMFGNVTPVGNFEIIQKLKNPSWHVPKQVQTDLAKRGVLVPKVMPPGPDNPLGDYALRLNNWSYLIHGTNEPPTIGRRASAGCLHMFPEDIEGLYPKVANHTSVTIINDPFKAGWSGNNLYFEAHQPLYEDRSGMSRNYSVYWRKTIQAATAGMKSKPAINWQQVKNVGLAQTGIPAVVMALE